MYKVGSPMKGCHNCGELDPEKERKVYKSGFSVFRAYKPWETKLTWCCTECGAKDLACWEPDELGLVEAQLGKEPLLGCRESVAARKKVLRAAAMKLQKPDPEDLVPAAVKQTRASKIQELERELAQLMKLVAERSK
jgi:hypothetical protein